MHFLRLSVFGLLGIFAAGLFTHAAPPSTKPIAGIRENTPTLHALTDARIVIAPGRVIERGALVLQDGVITAVGADVEPPAGARVWPLAGKTIYPGLIDAYTTTDVERPAGGSPYWNSNVRPELSVARYLKTDSELSKTLRGQGIVARLVVPDHGIVLGESALVSTADGSPQQTLLKERVALHLRLTVDRGHRDGYPNSPMGAVALARQAMYDARWYAQARQAFRADSTLPRPEQNDALARLAEYVDSDRMVIVETSDDQFALRADRFAREFGLNLTIRGSGREYQRLDAIQATGRPIILPLDFAKAPNVATPEAAQSVSLRKLMHWDHAPENPARLVAGGVRVAFCSVGSKRHELLSAARRAVERGLPADEALRALTVTPAGMFDAEDRLGTLEVGKAANLLVADGDLFDKKTKLLSTWVDGQRYELHTQPRIDLAGAWRVTADKKAGPLQIEITGEPNKWKGAIALTPANPPKKKGKPPEPEANELTHVSLDGDRLAITFDAKLLGAQGAAQLSLTRSATTDAPRWLGQLHLPNGSIQAASAVRVLDAPAEENDTATKEPSKKNDKVTDEQEAENEKKPAHKSASYPVNFPLGAYGRAAPPEQPAAVLFKNAAIWTCGEQGVIESGQILIGDGKILAVGREVEAPAGAIVIDVAGKHIAPGIIDCHSHMATDGGINESGQAITAEVRIGDFIDATDVNLYRQLAGGVTVANILHGSANPIGGQNQVIKLRWGALPEELKFAGAPLGIKFALGENVKQSNWGDKHTTRYPQTRMGVEQLFRDAFAAARQYEAKHSDWNANRRGLPPRRDLELDALVEILNHQRWIHCHSYRQDEILALLRVLEDHDVTIGTLQHILEGYKVADAMARHGAMGSSFSDWWAYKFEVYDAIPYNGALLHRAGVVVSFNSDDAELARHLNHEAAKAVKYGGVSPTEALKFVTINPARQLRIEKLTGSLEAGKQADLVVWSGPPLSILSRCEQTWIDGRKYFDRDEDMKQRARTQAMRAVLVQKILKSGAPMAKPGEEPAEASSLWPRHDTFCPHGDHGHEH
jgi:N-acetylglucosamine-6-phosphate deacetylase